MPEFLLLALAAGLGVAMMSGPLGTFVVWRKLAYFGDTLAHGGLIGVALGLFLQIDPVLSLIASSLVLAALLFILQRESKVSSDTLLGILSHSALAAGLICLSLLADTRVDLYGFLFGDILTSTLKDVIVIVALDALVLTLLIVFWKPLLSATLDEDLARVDGIPVKRLQLLLLLLIALVIAAAMKVVGVLMITALLIIPAAASRQFSRSPEAMAVYATLIGLLSVALGLGASFFLDTPAGPSIVIASSFLFLFSWTFQKNN